MRITHVLRGEDLLSSTPRQLALYDALAEIGVSDGTIPRFGHLPYVMGEGNRKLSKRDPQSSLNLYREQGFLPEGPAELPGPAGLVDGRGPGVLQQGAARGGVHPRPGLGATRPGSTSRSAPRSTATGSARCPADELAQRVQRGARPSGRARLDPVTADESATLSAAIPLVQERMETLGQAEGMLGFLFADEESFAVDPDDAARMLGADARRRCSARRATPWPASETGSRPQIEAALRGALIEGLGLKPKVAFGSLRVATTGRRVSPPLFESLELLGRERTLARIDAALA